MKSPSPAATLQVPQRAMRFAAPLQLAAASAAPEGHSATRAFSGVAYGGGVITDHGYWDAVAFDLEGLQAATPMPLLLQHDAERVIGVIEAASKDGGQLVISGRLFTGIEPAAAAVAAKADAGMPWQMSVGIYPDAIEEVQASATALVNGRPVTGRAHVFRRSRVRETSFVALGADSSTQAHVFNHEAGAVSVRLISTGASPMTDAEKQAFDAAQQQAAADKTRADKAEADLAALREQFAAQDKAERETRLKALWGDDFTADKAAPFMAMQPDQFGAAIKAIEAARAAALPAGFTAEQATAGSKPGSVESSVLLASARQMFGIKPA